MKICPNCGNDKFYAHQVCRLSIIVDGENNFIANAAEKAEQAVYDSEDPYGPYECSCCGAEYEDLRDLDKEFTKMEHFVVFQEAEHEFYCGVLKIKNWTEACTTYICHLIKELNKSSDKESFYTNLAMELRQKYRIEAESIDNRINEILNSGNYQLISV